MDRREEFVAKALEVNRDYEVASTKLRSMLREGETNGPGWDAAVSRQTQALKIWSDLLQEFADIHSGGVHGGG